MSTEGNTPDWHRLPHDPVGFFGLPADFDRRELKRQYNRLIRVYKPEKHPQEFQRIRAAFENLDTMLRYGIRGRLAMPSEEYRWTTDSAQDAAANSRPPADTRESDAMPSAPGRAAHPPVLALHERITRETPDQVYRQLATESDKTPYDYYALAVLSDLVDRRDGLQFARWILQGLTAHPHDLGLSNLLHDYLRGPVPAKARENLLVACSKIVREDAFFALTEPLWESLLRDDSFATFRSALERCEANLQGVSIDGRIAFNIQILRSAIWQADAAWTEKMVGFLEENFERIPPHLDYDVELLLALKAYVSHRSSLLPVHPLRECMDRAIRAYFTQDQATADHHVLEFQVLLTQDINGLLESFGFYGEPGFDAAVALWLWISNDVAERNDEPRAATAEDFVWEARAEALLEQIAVRTKQTTLSSLWSLVSASRTLAKTLAYALPVMLLGTAAMIFVPSFDSALMIIALAASLAVGLFVGRRISKWYDRRIHGPFCTWVANRCYRRAWRREVVNFLQRSHMPFRQFAYLVSCGRTGVASWLAHFIQQDSALPLYSTAQRFLV